MSLLLILYPYETAVVAVYWDIFISAVFAFKVQSKTDYLSRSRCSFFSSFSFVSSHLLTQFSTNHMAASATRLGLAYSFADWTKSEWCTMCLCSKTESQCTSIDLLYFFKLFFPLSMIHLFVKRHFYNAPLTKFCILIGCCY